MSATNEKNNFILRKKAKTNKTVYRNVLDTSHSLKWPRIQPELNKRILDNLLKILEPVGQYRRSLQSKTTVNSLAMKPTILSEMRLRFGINSVTRYLEEIIQNQTGNTNKMGIYKDIDNDLVPVLFICRRDIKPLQLCSHLLTMSALVGIKLVQLPLNAENTLSKALYLSKISCLLVKLSSKSTSVEEEALRVSLHEVSLVQTQWPMNLSPLTHHNNTHIKILETASNIKHNKKETKSII